MIAAYWLAETYHQHPDSFLALTPEEIADHVIATNRMRDAAAKARG